MDIMKKQTIYALMIIAMVTWGMAWSSAKIVNYYLPYDELVFLRFFIGFITMLPFLFFHPINIKIINKYTWLNIIIVSILFFLYNQCFFMGTDYGQAGKGGVFVTTTNPIITFVIMSLIVKRIKSMQLIAIMIGGMGGLMTLNVIESGIAHLTFSGSIYFVFCSFIWGVMTILMAKGQKHIDSISYILLCYLVTAVISIPFVDSRFIFDEKLLDWNFILHFIIVCNAMSIGTSIYMYASERLGPIQVSTFIFSVPFIAMSSAYLVLDEPIGLNVIIGGLLSILSIYMINKEK